MLIRAKKIMAGPEGVARPGETLEVSEHLGEALLKSGEAVRVSTSAAPAGRATAGKVESAEAPGPAETAKAPEAGKPRGR